MSDGLVKLCNKVCAAHSTVITFSEPSSRKRSFPDSDIDDSEELKTRRGLWLKPYRQRGELSGGEETCDGGSESEDAYVRWPSFKLTACLCYNMFDNKLVS